MTTRPETYYADVRRVQLRVVDARREGDSEKLVELLSLLRTEIAIVQDRIEREAQGLDVPALPQTTVDALEALP